MAVASGSVLSQTANLAAAARWADKAVTAVLEPPQLPVLFSLAVHCGMGAIIHLPCVAAALPESTPGAQIALGQAISVPSFRAAFHSGVYMGWSSTAPSATRPPQ